MVGGAADRSVLAERRVPGAFAAGCLLGVRELRDHAGCRGGEERHQAEKSDDEMELFFHPCAVECQHYASINPRGAS